MAIERISATEFATMISEAINSRDRTMDTNIGSIKDLRIDPFSEILEFQNNRIVYISELTSLLNADKLVPDDLDKIAFNESIVRWDGSSSVTVVTFARSQAPTVDITVPVNFPIATVSDPKTGRSVMFRTIETKTMYAAAASSYYNTDSEKYELGVAIASVLSGEETKVGSYTVKTMRRPISGFDEVYNKDSTTSGRGVETNQEIADRTLLHIQGSQLGTPAGIKSYLIDNFSAVEDAYVVYGNNSYLEREQYDAGASDIWILGSNPLTRTYIPIYPGVETLIPLDRQPLISVTSVISGATTFVEGTDYEIVFDTGIHSRSPRGVDGIKFLAGAANVPTNIGDAVTIEFQYNSLIDSITSFFIQPYYKSISIDKLYRWSVKEDIEIEGNLKVGSGNPDAVKNAVKNVLKTYINALKLGDDVEEFDLDREISKIRGVDNFVWVQLSIKDSTGVGDIVIPPYKYSEIVDSDLIINLT